MTRFHMTMKSRNRKTGPIPVSTTSSETCPPSCPLITAGCYAKGGPLVMHWRAVDDGARGTNLIDFCRKIMRLPHGQLWRHNQAGDLPGKGDAINRAELAAIVTANIGRKGFTYTHKPVAKHDVDFDTAERNAGLVRTANRAGFTVNLSANSPAHADYLIDVDAGPVVTLIPDDQPVHSWTPGGRKINACPAQYADTNCQKCAWCAIPRRGFVVGFYAHGSKRKAVSEIATAGCS